MDAQKTGAFIARLRKEKNNTQKELAAKLHVSDKAISRWETGKGFPDTALLKPLSDALDVSVGELLSGERLPASELKEQMDDVIVETIHDSRRKVNRAVRICVLVAVLVIAGAAAILVPMLIPPTAVEFVNKSNTTMLYALGAEPRAVYSDYAYREFSGGYEYCLPDGSERYVFTGADQSGRQVMAYMHCSGSGSLFGFRIGDDTVIRGNEDLGVGKTSLMEYLKGNGFVCRYDAEEYGRPNLVYINGERCNWFAYEKEDVFVNICISAYEGRRLLAFDIGLKVSGLETVFEDMRTGCALTLEDPYGLVTSPLEPAYRQWDPVTITAAAPEGEKKPLYLYINGHFIDKLTCPDPPFTAEYQITFAMWGAPITVLVTPDEPE